MAKSYPAWGGGWKKGKKGKTCKKGLEKKNVRVKKVGMRTACRSK